MNEPSGPSNVVSLVARGLVPAEAPEPYAGPFNGRDNDASRMHIVQQIIGYAERGGMAHVTISSPDEDPMALTPDQAEWVGMALIHAAMAARSRKP